MLRRAWLRSRGTVSFMIIWVCVGTFLALSLLDLIGLVSRSTAAAFFGLSYAGVVKRLWVHQFLTAPFVHAGLLHLLFNMLALWMLGPDVETRMGRRRYIEFSVVCAGASLLGSLMLTWGTAQVALGYSGVVFGILVAQAVFYPDRTIIVLWLFPMKMRYAVILFALLALYSMAASREAGCLADAASLAGGVAGFLLLRSARWRSGLTGSRAAASRAVPAQSRGTPLTLRSRLRRVLYRWREWRYHFSRKLR
jgi:membrane associated rhomboid family serine protease